MLAADLLGSGDVAKRRLEGAEGEEPSAKRQRPDQRPSGVSWWHCEDANVYTGLIVSCNFALSLI